MQKLSSGNLGTDGFSQLLAAVSKLKNKTARPSPERPCCVAHWLNWLCEPTIRDKPACKKGLRHRPGFFHLAAEGSSNPAFAHYQRARVYAMSSRKKEMLTELRLAFPGFLHEPSALDGDEFGPIARRPTSRPWPPSGRNQRADDPGFSSLEFSPWDSRWLPEVWLKPLDLDIHLIPTQDDSAHPEHQSSPLPRRGVSLIPTRWWLHIGCQKTHFVSKGKAYEDSPCFAGWL
jgi:hypothetical protein